MSKISNLDAALDYLARGWHPFPVATFRADKKKRNPLIKWKPYQTKKPTEEEVREWWAEWPDAGIGLATGSIPNLVVVDLDERSGADMDLTRWPETYTVRSPGGAHLYFTHPGKPVKNSAGKLGPGIDVRGDGGFIIAPPTVRGDGGSYLTAYDAPLAKYPGKPSSDDFNVDDIVLTAVPSWFDELIEKGAPEGQRNDSLVKLAGSMAARSVPRERALAELMEWGDRCAPPMERTDVIDVVRRIYLAERQKRAVKKLDENRKKFIDLMPLPDFVKEYGGYKVDWIVENWIPAASIGFMVSPPECYKSWLSGDIAVGVAVGKPLLGNYPVTRTGPVIVIQQEDHFGQTANRYTVQSGEALGTEDSGAERLYIQVGRDFHFGNPKAVKELREVIEEIRPVLVVIDPLYAVVDCGDHMVRAPQQMKCLKHLRDEFGVCFLLVHHAGKSKEINFDRERSLGSQLLNAFVEFGVQVAKLDETTTLAKRHFKMASPPEPTKIQWVINTVAETPVYAPATVDLSFDQFEQIVAQANSKKSAGPEAAKLTIERDTEMTDMILHLLAQAKATAGQLAKKCDYTAEQIKRELSELANEGYVKHTGKGVYALK